MSTTKEFTPEATYLKKLTDTVYALVGGGIASNSGFIITDYGVIVVDSSMTPAIASHLLAHIKSTTDKPILHLVNTHHHGDHTFGNQMFSPISILSHANCRGDLIASGESFKERQREMRPYLAEEIDRVEITPPSVTYTDRLVFEYRDKVIELVHLGPAHTRGDTVVCLPQDKILFAGDLFFNEIVPYAGDGFVTSWIRAMDTLDGMDINTIIPGHGAIADKQGLRQAREYLFLLRDQAKTCFEKGLDEAQAEDQVQIDKYAYWPAQERTGANITRLYKEFRGELERAYQTRKYHR